MRFIIGDCIKEIRHMSDNSIDAVVTDPPYGLKFMGKKWDYDVPKVELWCEVLRVLKPGAHLLSFGGTRTYHRMVVNIEDAGFEIRDQVQWLYGSGFPKSYNLKDEWQGWGTALKPANEPIVLARKPLEKGLTVAENVLKWGCGALNIDGTRIEVSPDDPNKRRSTGGYNSCDSLATVPNAPYNSTRDATLAQGRWPANLILDEVAAEMLDEQSGNSYYPAHDYECENKGGWKQTSKIKRQMSYGDSGGASRFFYVAKASKRERGEGNTHPTVKPIKLMEYLIKLVTPPNGIVLDPFAGSGSTGVAAKNLGFEFVGIEMNEEYVEIAKKRCEL